MVSIVFHDGVEIVEEFAFWNCRSLSGGIKLLGVREIEYRAFQYCYALSDVEFGDRLETIGYHAFGLCRSLRSIKIPSVRTVQDFVFSYCNQLTDVEFGIDLEVIGTGSFKNCPRLQRITIPLKDNLFSLDIGGQCTQFDWCGNLSTVDIVGFEGLRKTISSLLIEGWRDEMNQEINQINRELPSTDGVEKANAIRLWIRSVINRMERYKAEHNRLLKEHVVQLELAIWKTKLDEEEDNITQNAQTKRVEVDNERSKEEKRITSGADIIIKNVLPFLKLG